MKLHTYCLLTYSRQQLNQINVAAGKSGRFPRHFKANDIIKRTVALVGFPAQLEPSGLSKDGSKKRPDGYTSMTALRQESPSRGTLPSQIPWPRVCDHV